jgi:F-type H+-transporting ATPase subunit b
MGLVSPDYGTIFWMVLAVTVVFLILRKFGWGPILKMLKEREQSIEKALQAADEARSEMSKLKSSQDELMHEARLERDKLMEEARKIREQMIEKAREEASAENAKILEQARKQIESEKLSAISEIRDQVATLSVEIAEKILRKQLADRQQQEDLIKDQLRDLKLN